MEYPTNGYYSDLMTQSLDDDIASQNQFDQGNERLDESSQVSITNSKSKGKGRSKNFSEEEDNMLVSAWLNISKDGVQGNQQKGDTFWIRVEKYFHENKEFQSDRNWSSLKHRWQNVQKDVNQFQACLDSVERKKESGKTINDKIADAKVMFHRLYGKPFSVFHVWNILKNEPKWTDSRPSKKQKVASISAPSLSNPDNTVVVDVENTGKINLERPTGRKAEKERIRRERKQGDDATDPFIDEVKKFREGSC